MSFSRIYSAQTHLLAGAIVTVEVDITKNTLHAFTLVGLPDKAVDESKDRMSSALKNSGFPSPKNQNQKIVISLSPADLKKEGPYFDLAIALAYLLSAEEIDFDPEGRIFLGELSLNGELRSIKGALPLAEHAMRLGYKEIFLPEANAAEAALVEGIAVYGARTLAQVVDHLSDKRRTKRGRVAEPGSKILPQKPTQIFRERPAYEVDFADIRGQEGAKRGLEIAAAGAHNIAMYGPPGTGKTMLARAFSQILPDLRTEEVLEITGIHSVAGTSRGALLLHPPFRAPHHTSSYVSIIGGGTFPKPGEVTLAHKGVLFLDEFPEFEKRVIESLRQPLEDNIVSISRSKGSATFPSNFILIAAMNPCPCGNAGSRHALCVCKPVDLDRYRRKLSGPIMDRIDLWVSVGHIDYKKLAGISAGEGSESIRERVKRARSVQEERFRSAGKSINTNSEMNAKDIQNLVPLADPVRKILDESAERLSLSARAYHRVLKIARTIADLEDSPEVRESHILEAIQYRPRVNS